MSAQTPIKEVRQTGEVYKLATKSRNGAQFSVPAVYVLEDGSEIPTEIGSARKKDVLPYLEAMNRKAAEGRLEANFADGRFIGTRTTYVLFGKGSE